MISHLYIYTKPCLGNVERALKVLTEGLGLVPAWEDPANDRIYVWEDEERVGRYNVRFKLNREYGSKIVDIVMFQYWATKERASRKIFERDPMSFAIAETRKVLRGVLFETKGEFTIDELMMECTTDPNSFFRERREARTQK